MVYPQGGLPIAENKPTTHKSHKTHDCRLPGLSGSDRGVDSTPDHGQIDSMTHNRAVWPILGVHWNARSRTECFLERMRLLWMPQCLVTVAVAGPCVLSMRSVRWCTRRIIFRGETSEGKFLHV